MSKLIMLYKDGNIPAEQFSHLADVVVHNQWVPVPHDPGKVIEFVADLEEMERLAWFTKFADLDVLYVFDRPLELRERLCNKDIQQSVNVVADILLVQLDDRLHCLKNAGGAKSAITFICSEDLGPVVQPAFRQLAENCGYASEVLTEADKMRNELLIHLGASCELCDFCNCVDALDFYRTGPLGEILRIPLILWGEVRTYEEVKRDLAEVGHIYCANCAQTLAYEHNQQMENDSV